MTDDDDDRAALDRYLAANPAMTVRDWKGLGFTQFSPFDPHYVSPLEQPWDKLHRAEVRRRATTTKARFLPRSYRQAAARDPGLIWCERTRAYRLRDEATLAPQAATGLFGGEGVQKANLSGSPVPAAGSGRNANTDFPGGDDA